MEDNLIQLIVTISDTDIRAAAVNNDITKFLQLCTEKGIIKNFDLENSPMIKKIIEKNPDIMQFVAKSPIYTDSKSASVTSSTMQFVTRAPVEEGLVAVAVAVVAGVAVFIWAVAVTHVATVNVAVAATVVETVAAVSHVTVTSGSRGITENIFQDSNQDPFVLQLWNLNGGDRKKTYALLSEYTERKILSVIEALKQTYPEKFKNINDDDLRQFLALNVQNLLG